MMLVRAFLPLVLIPALAVAESRPLRIACMLDQTGSTLVTRVPRLQVSDFDDFLSQISEVGGELAVGVIRDRSNRPLLRCRVEQQPANSLQPPAENINVFLRQKLTRAYMDQQQKQAQIQAAWRDESRRRIGVFRQKLAEILQFPLAGRTDIQGAILRADLFLNEPDDGWSLPTRRYAVFHTDGIDNVHGPVSGMGSGGTVLLINGSALVGAINVLKPIRLENFAAAGRYIRSQSRGEK